MGDEEVMYVMEKYCILIMEDLVNIVVFFNSYGIYDYVMLFLGCFVNFVVKDFVCK